MRYLFLMICPFIIFMPCANSVYTAQLGIKSQKGLILNPFQNSFSIKVLGFVSMGESDNSYLFMVDKATKNSFKKGDVFDIVSETGDKFKGTFQRLEPSDRFLQIVALVSGGDNPIGNLQNSDFYIVSEGGSFPGQKTTVVEEKMTTSNLSVVFSGKVWKANGTSALYYEGGNSMMDETGKPYFQIGFSAVNAPDNRKLTFTFMNFVPNIGKIKSPLKVLMTGHDSGDLNKSEVQGYQVNPKFPEQATNLVVEITKWERISVSKAKISGTFSGKLKGLMGAPDLDCQNGIFENMEVDCYTQKY
jgi:hypothetical protein